MLEDKIDILIHPFNCQARVVGVGVCMMLLNEREQAFLQEFVDVNGWINRWWFIHGHPNHHRIWTFILSFKANTVWTFWFLICLEKSHFRPIISIKTKIFFLNKKFCQNNFMLLFSAFYLCTSLYFGVFLTFVIIIEIHISEIFPLITLWSNTNFLPKRL